MAQLGYSDIKITIDIDDPVTTSIKKEIENVQYNPSESKPFTIFRMPSYLRERNKSFYEPRVVSIGPYHQGAAHLKGMEEQKRRYVHKIQHDNPSMPLDEYVRAIRKLESAARECYSEGIDHMSSDEFITMLVLDSIFIIQVAVNWSYQTKDRDIVRDISWNVPLIKSDLLLLENQIPFFVLEEVFKLYSTTEEDRYSSSCTTPSNFDTLRQESDYEKPSLFEVLVWFLDPGDGNYQTPVPDRIFDHLLGFYYDCYMSIQERNCKKPLEKPKPKKIFSSISSIIRRSTMKKNCALGTTTRSPRMISCATELKEAGITFKRSDSNSIYGVNFSRGVLKMPYITIEENTMPRIMNLIAFEQCSCLERRPFTSYAVLMDCIINTPKDVLILQQAGIIENKLDDENKLAMFFNQLRYCCILDYEKHHLAGLFQEVKKYCDSKWAKYRAKLCRNYFNSPWTIISLIGCVFVLFFTAIQSGYGVLAYHHPPK